MEDWRNIFKIAIDETISKEIPLTLKMITNGELKKGDFVTPTVQMSDRTKKYTVYPDQNYEVVKIPIDNRFPGFFVIKHPEGGTWGFHFGKGGMGEYFNKVETSSEARFFTRYEELPYFVLRALKQNITLDIKQIVQTVMTQNLDIDQESMSKIVSDLKFVIMKLEHYGFIGTIEGKVYSLTQKGKEFLNAK